MTMNAELVMDTIACLMALADSTPESAQSADRLRGRQEHHPDNPLRLLCSGADHDGQVRCDALLRLSQDSTLALTICRDGTTPWLARAARRTDDGELLRVNGCAMTVEQAIAHLDGPSCDSSAATRLVEACLVQAALKQHPVEMTDLELQRTVEGFRRAHRLYTAADTRRWMDRRGIDHAELERIAADHAAVALLRSRIAAGRVAGYFQQHHAELDVAHIAQIQFTRPEDAHQVHADITAGRTDFFTAAQDRFQRSDLPQASLFRMLRRGPVPTPLSSQVFDAAAGTLLAPIDIGEDTWVIRVQSIVRARLDDATRDLIERHLFSEWLERQRASAVVEWICATPPGRP